MRFPQDTPRRLAQVFWIGGGSGAGKSTLAQQLADTYGLRVYSTDEAMADHAARCDRAACPALTRFRAMSMDERWLDRSPQEMVETFHWFRGEAFELIIEDLLALAAGDRVIVEGFRLLPHLVEPLLASSRQAIWLIPTPAFRRTAFEARGSLMEIAGRTTDPPRALQNLLARDHLFTHRVAREAAAAGLATLGVDGSLGPQALTATLAERLGL